MPEQVLATCVGRKIVEGIKRTDHLIQLVPGDRMEWKPSLESTSASPAVTLGRLLGHLLDCVAGFCAAFLAAFPLELGNFSQLSLLTVNRSCLPSEASERIALYSLCINRGFEICMDADLGRRVPTVFVPEGEHLLTILLGNFEHLTNHKYQLFFYLKTLGVPVASEDLYCWRGSGKEGPAG
jgi:hypothetical protein